MAAPRRDFIDQMAAHWLAAEREHNAAFADPAVAFVGMLEIARDRVLRVYEGNVRWDDASPGDRAVWIGRPRNREVYERFGKATQTDDGRARRRRWRAQAAAAGCGRYGHDFPVLNVLTGGRHVVDPNSPDPCRRCGLTREQERACSDPDEGDHENVSPITPVQPLSPGGVRLHGYRERLWWNFYDTVTLGPNPRAKAFSNANIGTPRCNLDVGNQFPDDMWFIAMDFYVVPCLPAGEVPWNRVLGQLIVGNKPATSQLPLAELFMGTGDGWEQRPYTIPQRQNFVANLELLDEPMEPFELVVHLEGLLTREVH